MNLKHERVTYLCVRNKYFSDSKGAISSSISSLQLPILSQIRRTGPPPSKFDTYPCSKCTQMHQQ